MEYDEQEAISYILSKVCENINEDDILNIIDIIWDYYEDNGMLEITFDSNEEDTLLSEKLISHTIKMLKKDKYFNLSEELVAKVVLAELEYEESIDIF